MKISKRLNCSTLALILLGVSILSCVQYQKALHNTEQFHNVIVLIPDGCGTAHMTIARWFKGAPLAQDSMAVSVVQTYCANSMITGSAAATTAFASGFKTWEDARKAACLAMHADSLLLPTPKELPALEKWRPGATVLEGARLTGRSVGLVATSRITHATPAGYASHWHARDDESIIMEQMVYNGVDIAFGGGFRYLINADTKIPGVSYKGVRKDGDNLYEVLKSLGYEVITTEDELNAIQPQVSKVWGMFAASHMAFNIDQPLFAPQQPSLVKMTKKAIEILSKNPKGFFLMVEGSHVDWASHDNDPVGVVTEYLAFDQAVEVALDFARSHSEQRTLVLVFPDHDNGGMSLGRNDVDTYEFEPEDMNRILRGASLTADGVEWLLLKCVRDVGLIPDSIENIIARYYGFTNQTETEEQEIFAELADTTYVNVREIIGSMMSERAGIGWTTFDHTGNDVPMFSYGLSRAPQTIDNTEIAYLCAKAMGFQLSEITDRLFADACTIFGDATLAIDTAGVESSEGYLTVSKNAKQAVFPFFKNIMIIGHDTIPFEGITVYSPNANRVFLPEKAAELFAKY
jgi:alkaline phosphatase